jgi:excisionase family DNA binding protein
MVETNESLNVKQAAQLLGLRPATIYKLCCIRSIPHYKLGARTIFDREELLSWRAARRVPTLDERQGGAT